MLITTAITVIAPKILSRAINILFYGFKDSIEGTGEIDFNALWIIILILLSFFAIQFVLSLAINLICTKISKEISFNLRDKICMKIYKLPSSYFENNKRGEILSLLTNDVEQIGEHISEFFFNIVNTAILTVASICMMFTINIPLTIASLVFVPLVMIISYFVVKKSQHHYSNQQNLAASVNSYIDETFSGHSIIRAYNKQKETIDKFNSRNKELFEESLKGRAISNINSPLNNFLNKNYYVIVVTVGAYLCTLNMFTVGDIQAFIQYLNSFNSRARQFISIFDTAQQMYASSKRISEFLAIKDYEINNKNKLIKTDNFDYQSKPIIEFDNINFSYNTKDKVIKDLSLKVYQGQTIAIVGPTGAGKTTLTKLLLRFYDNYQGCIKLFGQDIKEYNFDDVRQYFSIVMQNVWIFYGNFYHNIKYGKFDASCEEIEKISKISGADNFIQKLPRKYEEWIYEGGINLSQGQKQLISISRALIANKDILILDEATSSIDTNTEKQLFDTFDKLIKNKTSIVIAHRLSTIKNADKIVVINNGQIVEIGNHDSLINKKGFYYDIYKSGINKG